MGCASMDSVPSAVKLSFARNNIREAIALNQPIASNPNSCLLRGNERSSSEPIFVRFSLIKQSFRERLERKVSKIYSLQPKLTHLVPYLYVGNNPLYYYIVMEDLGYEGLLDALVNKHFEVTEFNLCFGLRGMLETLATMHRNGVCHGQIIPEKILARENVCYLLDPTTGLESAAELLEESRYYAAPEVLNGETPTPNSDVWSLGALIYYLITGHTVYATGAMTTYINIAVANEPSFTDPVWRNVSPELVGILKRMLKRSEERVKVQDIIDSEWFNTVGLTRTVNLMGYGDFLLEEISSQKAVREAINLLANEMSKSKLEELLAKLQGMDYMKKGKVELKFLLEKVLDPEHRYLKKLDKGNLQVDYKSLIESAIQLNGLIIPERMAAIFYQKSKDKKHIKSAEIRDVMISFGMSVLFDKEDVFEREIKSMQTVPRKEANLTYEEFCRFLAEKHCNIPEEMIFM